MADRTSVVASYVGGLCAGGEFEGAVEACEGVLDELVAAGYLPVAVEVVDDIGGGNDVEDDVEDDVVEVDHRTTSTDRRRRRNKKKKHGSPIVNVRVACNTVLHASVATSNDGIMDRVVHAMASRGMTPDTVTYNALLRRSLRRREGSLAIKEGIAEMQRMGLVPDQTSIEILIQSYALQGEIEDAERAVGVIIDEYGVEVGRAWGTLMAACGMAGDVENVAHVFSKAVEYVDGRRGADGDGDGDGDGVYGELAGLCLKALHDALGKECWRRALHAPAGAGASSSTSTSSKKPAERKSKEVLLEYLEEVAVRLLQDVDDLLAGNNIRRARRRADEREIGLIDDRMLCLAALGKADEVMAEVGDVPLVHGEDRMMRVLVDRGGNAGGKHEARGNAVHNNHLLHAMARLGKLEHCFGLIQTHNVDISAKEYVALIEACAGHSPPMEELARRLMAHARERGMSVGPRFYNALLLVRARLEGLDGVHDGIDEMRARGVEPNVFTYFVLREAAVIAKDTHAAASALERINDLQQGYGGRGDSVWRGFYELEFADDDW